MRLYEGLRGVIWYSYLFSVELLQLLFLGSHHLVLFTQPAKLCLKSDKSKIESSDGGFFFGRGGVKKENCANKFQSFCTYFIPTDEPKTSMDLLFFPKI